MSEMTEIKRVRKLVNYMSDVPRCGTCHFYRKPYVFMTTNSRTKKSNPHCKLNDFRVGINSVCDAWVSVDRKEILDLA